jgi:hypothetical protein
MKWLSQVLPFLDPYPGWVKALIFSWLLLTAVCGIVLIVGRSPTLPNPTSDAVWLKINRVEIFDDRWRDVGVRVIANVNGNIFAYPIVGGGARAGLFNLPPSNVFQINFSMAAKSDRLPDETRFVSQGTDVVEKEKLPHSAIYKLHMMRESRGIITRSAGVAAQIAYTISNRPD